MSFIKEWEVLSPDNNLSDDLAKSLNISPVLAQILVNRGITNYDAAKKFLYPDLSDLESPFLLKDVSKACSIITQSIAKREKIIVFGDYDTDGVTSTAILVLALRYLGADVFYYIPHRTEEGYGISAEGIKYAKDQKASLAITVDNGITSIEEVNYLHENKIKVIITDHHNVGKILPAASAIINPKQKDCSYPNKDLAGAGVVFKLIQALFEKHPRIWMNLLDLVAIGTIADSVTLIRENRILAKVGLKKINESPRIGIKALLEVSSVKGDVDVFKVLYILSPRINAAGRLEKADLAVQLLLSEDYNKAKVLAKKLDRLNASRQKIETAILQQIEQKISQDSDLIKKPALVLADKNWHIGILGIIASRLVNKFYKPVFLISSNKKESRGSARSPEGVDIFQILSNCGNYLHHFGGHTQAGGFSLEADRIDDFTKGILIEADKYKVAPCMVKADLELPLQKINLDLAKEIELLAPFGQDNPVPLFLSKGVSIVGARWVGRPPIHLKCNFKQQDTYLSAIGFRKDQLRQLIWPKDFFYDVVYSLELDNYNNMEKISLQFHYLKAPSEDCWNILKDSQKFYSKIDAYLDWRIIDARCVKSKEEYLKSILKNTQMAVVLVEDLRKAFELKSKIFSSEVMALKDNDLKIDLDTYYSKGIKMIIIPFKLRENITGEVFDIIYYSPPLSFEDFNFWLRKTRKIRLHLLFNENILNDENLERYFLSRKNLVKIYQAANKVCRSEGIANSIQEIATSLKNFNIDFLDLERALVIFEEMGLVDIQLTNYEKRVKFIFGRKGDLENSPTYLKLIQARREFEYLKDLLLLPRLDLLKKEIEKRLQTLLTSRIS